MIFFWIGDEPPSSPFLDTLQLWWSNILTTMSQIWVSRPNRRPRGTIPRWILQILQSGHWATQPASLIHSFSGLQMPPLPTLWGKSNPKLQRSSFYFILSMKFVCGNSSSLGKVDLTKILPICWGNLGGASKKPSLRWPPRQGWQPLLRSTLRRGKT